jgi:hypothetical protein
MLEILLLTFSQVFLIYRSDEDVLGKKNTCGTAPAGWNAGKDSSRTLSLKVKRDECRNCNTRMLLLHTVWQDNCEVLHPPSHILKLSL